MPKILLDLDRTLFDTPRFVEILWAWIEGVYQIDAEAARADMPKYFTYVGEMYDYDFFGHIRGLGIPREELVTRASMDLAEISFIYDDVTTFLEDNNLLDGAAEILTFGNADYQRFKLSFCPILDYLVNHITQGYKAEYIESHWPATKVILIDDRLLTGQLSRTVQLIQINREQVEPVIEHPGYRSVSSLAAIEKQWLA